MKTTGRPLESHTAIIDSFFEYAEVPEEEKRILRAELKRYVENRIKNKWFHPLITKFHTDWYREFYRLVEKKNPYEHLIRYSNDKAREVLTKTTPQGFKNTLMFTIIGNKIDFGACLYGLYDVTKLEDDIKNIDQEKLSIDDSEILQEAIRNATNIFFLFDNNGELMFDELLLQWIRDNSSASIVLVGKETPMINDVTVTDLRENGFEKYGEMLSTGSNCFGLHEEEVSDEFRQRLKRADLIIAKGQSYMEFFMQYNFKNVLNILRVKNRIVGKNVPDLQPDMNIVMDSRRYAGLGYDYRWDLQRRTEESVDDKKIKTLPELLSITQRLKKQGKHIAWTNGCFDILHVGHIRYLQAAKRLGDILVVGLNTDASVRRLKGPSRPIHSEQERAEILSALSCIDYIILFGEDTPLSLIEQVVPHVIVKGGDYHAEDVVGYETMIRTGGRTVIIPSVEGRSTTHLIDRVRNARVQH